MKKIILAGNSITADILYSYLLQDSRYHVLGMTVDDEFMDAPIINELEVIPLSQIQNVHSPTDCSVIMAIGYNNLNRSRESIFLRLKEIGYNVETYIHPDAKVFTTIPLGEGCVIMPSAVIEPHVNIGKNTMVWANVTIAHHSSVGDHCWIASGAVIAGKAMVGHHTFVGVNATIVDKIAVGEHCIIGAGALITRNTKPHSVHLARSGEEFRCSSQDYVSYFGI